MEQYCNQLEQQIEKQTTELAAANGNFRLQTAECQRLEQCFIQLQTKLSNINSIIKDQLELREARPRKVLKSSTFGPAPLGCAYMGSVKKCLDGELGNIEVSIPSVVRGRELQCDIGL